jgi:hypothetical protein
VIPGHVRRGTARCPKHAAQSELPAVRRAHRACWLTPIDTRAVLDGQRSKSGLGRRQVSTLAARRHAHSADGRAADAVACILGRTYSGRTVPAPLPRWRLNRGCRASATAAVCRCRWLSFAFPAIRSRQRRCVCGVLGATAGRTMASTSERAARFDSDTDRHSCYSARRERML